MRRLLQTSVFAIMVFGIERASSTTTISSSANGGSCLGTSTYAFEPLGTVYVTVEGNYTYTATINGSTPADIYYTPPPPCESVIIPTSQQLPSAGLSSAISLSISTISGSTPAKTPLILTRTTLTDSWITACDTFSITSNSTRTTVPGLIPYINSSTTTTRPLSKCSSSLTQLWTTFTETIHPDFGQPASTSSSEDNLHSEGPLITKVSASIVRSTLAASGAAPLNPNERTGTRSAVTVTVTKKTPVVVPTSNINIETGSSPAPGPTFPGDDPDAPITLQTTALRTPSPTQPTFSQDNGDTQRLTTSPSLGTGHGANGGSNSDVPGDNSNGDNGRSGSESNPNTPKTLTGGSGLGSIINSAFNSPFTAIVGVSTSLGAASATVTLIAGVPVQVGSSSVYIGGSNVALPTGSSTAFVTIAGQTFTIKPSAVIAGTSTLSLTRAESVRYSAIQGVTQIASTITRSGIIVTIGPTAAVVSGSTFLIGVNAPLTTAIIQGQTIAFGSNGVAFASSTYAPALITGPAYVVTTIGSITISIDPTQAIIDGTTYRIGAGSLNTLTSVTIAGTVITFGPSGIYLPSTTIAPTSIQLTDNGGNPITTTHAATRVLSNTSGAVSSGLAAMTISRPLVCFSNIFCVLMMILGLAALPLSLFL